MLQHYSHRPWFLGIDDKYDFQLLQTSLYSARTYTTLQPFILHTGLSQTKLSYLNYWNISTIKVHPDPRIQFASLYPGAILRMYIPKIAKLLGISGQVLYTDSDVLFLSDPILPQIDVIAGSSYHPHQAPTTTNIVNSGVLILNVDAMAKNFRDFIKFSISRPDLHNAAAESIYHYYYEVEPLSYKFNFFAYWDQNILGNPVIIHFHGPKPNLYEFPSELHPYLTAAFFNNKEFWNTQNKTRIRNHDHIFKEY